jgi:hypothetical protein
LSTVGSTPYHLSLKSLHDGLVFAMSASFFARIQPFNCFSRAIAPSGVTNRSNQTSRLQLLRCRESLVSPLLML